MSTNMLQTNQKHRELTLREKIMALVEKLTLRTTIMPLENIRIFHIQRVATHLAMNSAYDELIPVMKSA